ncbi:MAG: translation initiation factor IF-6 [Candidatus Nanohaloarchaea archaeon]
MIERYSYEGDANLGFAATVTPEYGVFPPEFRRKEFFDLTSVETFVARTRLPGIFTAGNSECIMFPSTITRMERSRLEESDICFEVMDLRQNAIGNLVLANDTGALISPRIEDARKRIEELLGVKAEVGTIAGIPNVGAAAVANNRGAVLHREASEEEARDVKRVLGVDNVDIGTVNLGSPYIGSGLVCTDEEILVGENTSGPEVGRIDRNLQG